MFNRRFITNSIIKINLWFYRINGLQTVVTSNGPLFQFLQRNTSGHFYISEIFVGGPHTYYIISKYILFSIFEEFVGTILLTNTDNFEASERLRIEGRCSSTSCRGDGCC